MKGKLGNLMRQAQKLQEEMKRLQEEIAAMEVTGEAGGGLVAVTMTGRHEVRRVRIDESLLGEDREMLEDLIACAVNDAVGKVERAVQERFQGLAGGLGLPGGLSGLPF